jgi:hypothetical protein
MCNNFILIRPRRPIQTGCVSCIGELALLAKCGLKTLKKRTVLWIEAYVCGG